MSDEREGTLTVDEAALLVYAMKERLHVQIRELEITLRDYQVRSLEYIRRLDEAVETVRRLRRYDAIRDRGSEGDE